jgi:N-sulfoglucosamine sulfohydrolase
LRCHGYLRAVCLLLTVFATQPVSAGATAQEARPNILLVVLDDWGAGDAGAYGSRWIKTPNFDRLAREGVLFSHAFTSNPKCSPSRASLLTGRNAWQLDEGNVHNSTFPDKYPVYPDLLEKAGYAIGLTGKGWGPGDFRNGGRIRNPAGPSFDDAKLDAPTKGIRPTDYAKNFEQFLATRRAGQPFCFWLGIWEPHRAYEKGSGARLGVNLADVRVPPYLPDNEVTRGDLADYAAEVEWADAQVGRVLAALEAAGELENTLIVMTSDNGMPFPRAKGQIYDYDFRLPLAMRWGQRIQPGRVVEDFVNFRDFAPTFLQVAGVVVPAAMTGRSLQPLLESTRSGWIDPAANFAVINKERHDLGRPYDAGYPVRAIRTTKWLYVHNYAPERWPAGNPETDFPNCDPSPTKDWIVKQRDKFFDLAFGFRPAEMLYQLDEDPYCLENVALRPESAGTVKQLRGQLEKFLLGENDPRALGYGEIFDTYPYVGSRKRAYETWLREQLHLPALIDRGAGKNENE